MIFINQLYFVNFRNFANIIAFGQNFELQLQFGRGIMPWHERTLYFKHKFLADSYVKKAIQKPPLIENTILK